MIDITVPGDKSISHRALMLAALARGKSRIRGLLDSDDVRSTAACLSELGVAVGSLGDEVTVHGQGLRSLRTPSQLLDCGNSGTTARLLMGIVAGQSITATFDGDASLRGRPMRRVTEPLTSMGAQIAELGAPDRLPLRITGGTLHPIDYPNSRSSAQVKSAILLAGLTGGVAVAITEPVLSRDHTERMLGAMGMQLRTVVDQGAMRIELDPIEQLDPLDITVPGDLSSAAFFLARGLLSDRAVRMAGVGVNATRSGFLDVVRRMHGVIEITERGESGTEPTATLIASRSELRATHVEANEIPRLIDEIPLIAMLAARAQGTTEISGAAELRVKESDRITAVVGNLRAVGVQAEEQDDGMVIRGRDAPLRGRVQCFGDHRIAMAFGILGSLPGNDIEIDDTNVVAVSFPDFWRQLEACKG